MKEATLGVRCPTCKMQFTNLLADIRIVASLGDFARVRVVCPMCGPKAFPVEHEWFFAALSLGMPEPISSEDVVEFQMQMLQGDYLAGVAQMEAAE